MCLHCCTVLRVASISSLLFQLMHFTTFYCSNLMYFTTFYCSNSCTSLHFIVPTSCTSLYFIVTTSCTSLNFIVPTHALHYILLFQPHALHYILLFQLMHFTKFYCSNSCTSLHFIVPTSCTSLHFNSLNAELNPICYLLALLGAHHFLHVSRIRVKSLTLRLLISYICMECLQLVAETSTRGLCDEL
jgi:hypothetical protein